MRSALRPAKHILLSPLVLLGLLPGAAAAPPEPAPLRCLARLYGVRAELDGGSWIAVLPGGQRLVYDDGKEKGFAERLDAPDLEDMFSIRYVPGRIRPVTEEDDDPGRIRVEALFGATYGQTRASVTVERIPFLGQQLQVNRRAAPAFARVAARLSSLIAKRPSLRPFLQGLGGTFVWRNIAGTSRRSAHSYGVSVDINVALSHYWRWQRPQAPLRWENRVPQEIVDAFEAEGFIWGGRWYHYDTMHFEYRPELLDPSCYPAREAPAGGGGAR